MPDRVLTACGSAYRRLDGAARVWIRVVTVWLVRFSVECLAAVHPLRTELGIDAEVGPKAGRGHRRQDATRPDMPGSAHRTQLHPRVPDDGGGPHGEAPRLARTFRPDRHGRFHVPLRPRRYTLQGARRMPRLSPIDASVRARHFTVITLVFDSGIR